MVSTAETYQHDSVDSVNYASQQRQRLDSAPVLMLPAPLAVNNGSASSTPSSRHSEDHGSTYVHESSSRSRLIPSPPSTDYNAQPQEVYSAHSMVSSSDPYSPSPLSIESYVNRAGVGANGTNAVLRQGTVSSQVPSETMNPFYRQNQAQAQQAAGYEDEYSRSTESDDTQSTTGPVQPRAPSRGVTLSDNGPVPGPEGVRRVARPSSRRPSSQQPPTNRYSRTSMYGSPTNAAVPNLPPGAAPPRPYSDF